MKFIVLLFAFLLTMVSCNEAQASNSDIKHECRKISQTASKEVRYAIQKRLVKLSLAEQFADRSRQAREYRKLAEICEPLMLSQR